MNVLLEYFVISALIMTPIFLVGYWAIKLMGWAKSKLGGSI